MKKVTDVKEDSPVHGRVFLFLLHFRDFTVTERIDAAKSLLTSHWNTEKHARDAFLIFLYTVEPFKRAPAGSSLIQVPQSRDILEKKL